MRLPALITAVVLALSAAACGEEDASNARQDAQPQAEGAPQQGREQVEDQTEENLGPNADRRDVQQRVDEIAQDTAELRRDLRDAAEGDADPEQLERLRQRASDLQERARELPEGLGTALAEANEKLAQVAGDLREGATSGDRQALDRVRERFARAQRDLERAAEQLEERYPGARESLEQLRERVPELSGR